jgi:hypothetical protein
LHIVSRQLASLNQTAEKNEPQLDRRAANEKLELPMRPRADSMQLRGTHHNAFSGYGGYGEKRLPQISAAFWLKRTFSTG